MSPFLHFASRRLRSEAANELSEVHRLIASTMSALSRASKRGRIDLEKAKEAVEQMLEVQKVQSTQFQQDLSQAQRDLQEKELLISQLRAQIALSHPISS